MTGSTRKKTPKFVYYFGGKTSEGSKLTKDILGGKGLGLAQMTAIGLPVPPGFTISTEVCEYFNKHHKNYPMTLRKEVDDNIRKVSKESKKKFGDPKSPLIVSVRSGAALSMPGMMETILNVGLNDVTVEGLAEHSGNRRFALDSYRRLILMYGSIAMGVDRCLFDQGFDEVKERLTRKRLALAKNVKVCDTDVNESELEEVIKNHKALYKKVLGRDFPQDPLEQLWGAINAVFNSWTAEKSVTYRRLEHIRGLKGTAVNVVTMVFGNMGKTSGTGVAFTRNPNTGQNEFFGDYLTNAQGEDVVAGIRTPIKLIELKKKQPEVYKQLENVRSLLEKNYRDMQDLEFTVEDGRLYMLQTRNGRRLPAAAFNIAVALVNEKVITKEEAVARVRDKDIEGLFYPVVDTDAISAGELASRRLAVGIDAVPGAAAGKIVFSAATAEKLKAKGEKVILVRKETSPEDVGGMHAAVGILTATGGKTSHAAVVARGWGKCCIVGCDAIELDYERATMKIGAKVFKELSGITLNGTTGEVFEGELPLREPEMPKSYKTLMKWADEIRHLKVRTNADTPEDARKAIELGAEGIGLTRTEHMFFSSRERQLAIQEMIIAENSEARKKALTKLLPYQRTDFEGIFEAMAGRPVTIRLIDPPLHEFVPHDEPKQRELASIVGVPFEKVKHRIDQLHEMNPMLGHRGCRLLITYPEILDMQVTAIIEAACNVSEKKIKVHPEIMIPLTLAKKEFQILANQTRAIANGILHARNIRLPYTVGTMIEIPRAALLADQLAEDAEFFSFGTNDLTQMTLGLSRDDAGHFLPDYVDEHKAHIFDADPFQSLDQTGVGKLIEMGITLGRSTRKGLKVGICGEHGGELQSVKFCHRVGMDYVSCSPFRVPIARLAAAQAVLEERKVRPLGTEVKHAKPRKNAV